MRRQLSSAPTVPARLLAAGRSARPACTTVSAARGSHTYLVSFAMQFSRPQQLRSAPIMHARQPAAGRSARPAITTVSAARGIRTKPVLPAVPLSRPLLLGCVPTLPARQPAAKLSVNPASSTLSSPKRSNSAAHATATSGSCRLATAQTKPAAFPAARISKLFVIFIKWWREALAIRWNLAGLQVAPSSFVLQCTG